MTKARSISKEKEENSQFIFTTEQIDEINDRNDKGFKISRQEKFWLSNFTLVKKNGLVFSMTEEEEMEYIRCKVGVDINGDPVLTEDQTIVMSGIQYFSEKFCKIKNEEGVIQKIRLRDYQKEILDLYTDNRFSLLCGSRQIGKCYLFDTQIVTEQGKFYIFELWYKSLVDKTVLDRLKYHLYKLSTWCNK